MNKQVHGARMSAWLALATAGAMLALTMVQSRGSGHRCGLAHTADPRGHSVQRRQCQ